MMIMVMRTRFVLTVGKPSPVTAPGINTCRTRFATSLCPGPQCHLGTLRHPLFLQLSCSKKAVKHFAGTEWLSTVFSPHPPTPYIIRIPTLHIRKSTFGEKSNSQSQPASLNEENHLCLNELRI